MLLVFEGPDGAGKTTLLQAVHQKLLKVGRDARIYRNMPRPDVMGGVMTPDAHIVHAEYNCLSHFDLTQFDLLKDRFWVTDEVYSKVYLRDPYDRSYVKPWADFKSVMVIHVNVHDWRVLARRRKVESYEHAYDFFEKLSLGFKAYFKQTSSISHMWAPVLEVTTDTAGSTPDMIAEIITDAVVKITGRSTAGWRA